jgi:hypothetical protein
LIAAGQINKREFETAKQMNKFNREQNLGYAFITFSHADEAKKALLLTSGEVTVGAGFVQLFPKSKLDHSELDKSYFMRKIMNESKLVEHREKIRETKQELRDFERNIEEEMPKL